MLVPFFMVFGGMELVVIASSTHHFDPSSVGEREVLLSVMVIVEASSRASWVGEVTVNVEVNEKRSVMWVRGVRSESGTAQGCFQAAPFRGMRSLSRIRLSAWRTSVGCDQGSSSSLYSA